MRADFRNHSVAGRVARLSVRSSRALLLALTQLAPLAAVALALHSAPPPGGFPEKYSWETVQTFCFPGATGTAGYGGHPGNEQMFSADQIRLYTKYDLVMISMINQTALHPATPHDGYFVPQATAMSIKQAAAIKAARADVPVFAYITGYLAQSTFEGPPHLLSSRRPARSRR